MSVRGLVSVVIGVVAFVVIDSLITNIKVMVSRLSNQTVNRPLIQGTLLLLTSKDDDSNCYGGESIYSLA